MRITRLSATNFRNYRSLELDLPQHLTVLQGENAQGKTNLLEIVHFIATTRSHRTSNERDLLHQAALEEEPAYSRLTADVERARDGLQVEIVLQLERRSTAPDAASALRKRIRVNDIARRAMDYVGSVNAVVFSAGDIDLVSGAPGLCRRYLDIAASQVSPRYLRVLHRYNRVLMQRNSLLKQIQEQGTGRDQLEFWDRELVENGAIIMHHRRLLVEDLGTRAARTYTGLSGGAEALRLVYQPNVEAGGGPEEIAGELRRSLARQQRKEVLQGVTLVGPHRDGVQFLLNGADAGKYASRGQQQSIVLALKLAEAAYMHDKAGEPPVLLLDDVFSELDRGRRQHLLESIPANQQVLISTIDLDCFSPSFLSQATLMKVKEGRIQTT